MVDSVYPATGGFVDNTSAATFIPELWSDEIRAAFKQNLTMANLVKKMPMKGKKGDTVRIPAPIRGDAHAKVENTAVTVQNNTEGQVVVEIDRHYEFSRLIEDITEVQALDTLRQFYTDDAGYGLARQMDTDLFTLGTGLGNGTYDATPVPADWVHSKCFFNDAANGKTLFAEDTVVNADTFDDAFLRGCIQELDDEDVPMDSRYLVVPPALKNTMLGIDRFNSRDFSNTQGVASGQFGEVYGIPVYVSTNCPVIETAAQGAAGLTVDARGAFLFHRDAFILAEQMDIRSQIQDKLEWLGTLYVADCLYGIKNFRPEAGIVMAVPNIAA
jgi:N4-gp56 family major capsid protein